MLFVGGNRKCLAAKLSFWRIFNRGYLQRNMKKVSPLGGHFAIGFGVLVIAEDLRTIF